MKKIKKVNLLLGYFILIFTCFLGFFSTKIYPQKFFLDSGLISVYMKNLNVFQDTAYQNTAKFFLLFHFKENTDAMLVAGFALIIFFAFLMTIFFKYNFDISNKLNFSLLTFFSFFFTAYMCQYSKDLIILFFLTIFMIIEDNTNLSSVVFIVVLILYGIVFRHYWLLIVAITVIYMYLAKHFYKSKLKFIFLCLLTVIFMQILYFFITGDFLSNARFNVNILRNNSDNARTITRNLLDNTSIFTDIINSVYGFINLLIPANGLGSVNEIVYYLWLYLNILRIFPYLKKYKIELFKNIYFSFYLAFIVVQAFFEPDMGSTLRHQLIVFPILIVGISKIKKV